MAVTNFMNLDLPTVSVTLGPEWADQVNAAFEVIDEHDHSSGKGVKVKVAGIDINANLDFQNHKAYDLFSTQYEPVTTALTGATNANSISVYAGDLYYTNGAGNSVQITAGGSVVTTPGALENVDVVPVNSDLIIGPADPYVFLQVDTTSARTITLPLASAVSEGRIYIIKDSSGMANTNPITVAASGSDLIDGAASVTIESNYESVWFVGDSGTTWNRA